MTTIDRQSRQGFRRAGSRMTFGLRRTPGFSLIIPVHSGKVIMPLLRCFLLSAGLDLLWPCLSPAHNRVTLGH